DRRENEEITLFWAVLAFSRMISSPLNLTKRQEAQSMTAFVPPLFLCGQPYLISEDLFLFLQDRLAVAVCGSDRSQRHKSTLRLGFFENVLTIEGFHTGILG